MNRGVYSSQDRFCYLLPLYFASGDGVFTNAQYFNLNSEPVQGFYSCWAPKISVIALPTSDRLNVAINCKCLALAFRSFKIRAEDFAYLYSLTSR